MNSKNTKREQWAGDALLMAALWHEDQEESDMDPKHLPRLTEDEQAARKALGGNFIDQLLAEA